MGMCLALSLITDADIARVLADPPLIWKVIASDNPEAYDHARRESRGLLGQWFGKASTAPADFAVLSKSEDAHTDVDKAWHGIHYLLTQVVEEAPWPLGFLFDGQSVGDLDVGYGPARVLASTQVLEVSQALEPINESFLRARFDPARMMELDIYPQIWDRDPAEDDSFAYVLEQFEGLKAFIAGAARRKLGLVVYLT